MSKPKSRTWLSHMVVGLLLTVIGTHSASAQVTTLSSLTNFYHGTANASASFTVPAGSGTYRVLVVGIASSQTATGTARTATVTYGGQTLTLAAGDMTSTTARQHTAVYYLAESGIDLATSTTLAVTFGGGTVRVNDVWTSVYDYVDQSSILASTANYNNVATATSTLAFSTGLTVTKNDQAIEVISALRAASTTPRTITGYATNWTSANEQTYAVTDGVRNAVAVRSISSSNTNTTDVSSTTLSNTALASMTAISLRGLTYKSQLVGSISYGASTWCSGESRQVTLQIKNNGTAIWTNGTTGPATINIGAKWNANGTSWTDYHIRQTAGNLAPGATGTYTFTIPASNDLGSGATTPLAAGTNALTFDIVYEGISWFGDNSGSVGPGNVVFATPSITITTSPVITGTVSTCIGSTTTLSGSGTPAVSMPWTSSNEAVATVSNAGLVTIVAAGATTLTYTNSSGCSATQQVTVASKPMAAVTGQSNSSCYGANNGTITVSASGGVAPYSYSKDGGTTWVASATNPYMFSGLLPNHAYRIKVKDSVGCESK